MNTVDMRAKPHHGRNIKRIREMFGMKQEALALELGNDWTQRRISLLEQKEEVENEVLEEVARALKVTPEVIRNFDEEKAINIVSNTFQDFHDNAIASAMNYQCSFNPLDKIVEVFEENKKLYERLLAAEKEKVEMLERMMKTRQQV
jgi:transcriptional regulator with XRE-family HTH domain